jgi:acetolactate synthase-1/2/3 large subunit
MSDDDRSGDSVAKSVLRLIADVGVDTVFGLPGVHNLAFWRDESSATPRIVSVRHEQTTVYAADGFARASGGPGVALTTTGPGAANAVGAFGEAAMSRSPVVLIASEISTKLSRPGITRGVLHESADQAALFEPLAKQVFRPRTAEAAVGAVVEAFRVALQWPRGPVYVDIPTDVLSANAPFIRHADEPIRLAPTSDSLRAAAQLINEATRVVIWAGGGVVQSGAEIALARVAEKLHAPVVMTFSGRGALGALHPNAVVLPPHEPEIGELIENADVLIAVGSDFDGMMTRNWSMPMPDKLVAINCDAIDVAKNYEPTVSVIGDARLSLEALEELVSESRAVTTDLDALHSEVWARLRLDSRASSGVLLLEQINRVREKYDAVVVSDMAIPGYWVGGYGRFDRSRRLQYPVGWGTLGYALPASVGAGSLRKSPVLTVCGDGGIMFALGELAVLVEEDLPVTVLLVDDGGYGMLRYDQDHSGDPHRGVDLVRPDFGALGRAFGIETVEHKGPLDQLGDVLDEALGSRHPRLVILNQSLTPPRTTSPRWNE